MLNIDQLRSEYNSKMALFNKLADDVKYFLSQEIQNNKIKYHSFNYRIKEFNSFIEKIKRKNVKDPFQEIMDVVGLRIVCLFHSDVKDIGGIVEKNLKIVEKDDKIDSEDINIFDYMSLHYKAKLKDIHSDYKDFKDIPFEIQIRTIVQDAWASISHYLDYKNESKIPLHLKRDFHALSGLFYVADTHFEILRREVTEHSLSESGT
ncbi:MAG TPA: GTP pyrophosphokinase [Candidatus Wujingus californicus]|uniref:GTP pyrophosphokinase n=1 Tax=Candidatus Wujingus californicus TaxID=3367618 RepID=UPI0040298ECD